MREIKFRAYFPGNNLIGNVIELVGSNDGYKFFKVTAECFEDGRQQFYSSSNFILLQFTGLKDKAGVEIYEGDILGREGFDSWIVVWCVGTASFKIHNRLRPTDSYPMTRADLEYRIVIGNIYQHPNLLKVL